MIFSADQKHLGFDVADYGEWVSENCRIARGEEPCLFI
jgi:hypothetical protein